jgi:hypothetical protein
MVQAPVKKARPKAAPLRVQLTQFTWVKSQQMLVGEASDLFPSEEGMPRMFDIHSPKTGRTFRFTMFKSAGPLYDKEGDVVAWRYSPIAADCPVRTVVIQND